MSPADRVAGEQPPPHVLREYALLADGERGIIVGPHGEFASMCFRSWSDDALFSTLVGGREGYSVMPAGRFVWGGYYEPGTLVWRSRWVTDMGIVECREALPLPSQPGQAVILRRLIARRGPARLHVTLDPRASFGTDGLRGLRLGEDQVWRGRLGEHTIGWSGAPEAEAVPDGHGGHALCLELELAAGEQHDLMLVVTRDRKLESLPDPEAAWQGTSAEWDARIPRLDDGIAPRDARHAYAVLSGLTSLSGGMVAAATTSLPERAQQGRNYDYRYAWIRDQCYAGQAVARAGPYRLLDEALRFVRERLLEHGPELRPAYTAAGGPVPDERRLELPGYPGGATSSATGSTSSSSSTRSARRCYCSRPARHTIISGLRQDAPNRLAGRLSMCAYAAAASSVCLGCESAGGKRGSSPGRRARHYLLRTSLVLLRNP